MICPMCYKRIRRKETRCSYCGFKPSTIAEGSNKLYKQAKELGRSEDVIYTTNIPSDINKKHLVLLTIFSGYLGGHMFYIGRKAWGWFYVAGFIFFFFNLIYLDTLGFDSKAIVLLGSILRFISGIALLSWIGDIAKITTKTFKIPVLLPEKEEKQSYLKEDKIDFVKEKKNKNNKSKIRVSKNINKKFYVKPKKGK